MNRRVVSGWAAVVALGLGLGTPGCKHGGGSGDPVEPPGEAPAFPLIEGHVEQSAVASGALSFDELFVAGDELFEVAFNGLDGSGIQRLPDGTPFPQRFSRIPPGGGRFTGPNAQACAGCHNVPLPTSAGEAASNVLQDPATDGLGPFNQRNTVSLFGSAALQLLAEEITTELQGLRATAIAQAQAQSQPVMVSLVAKGISYGELTANPDGSVDTSAVEGITADLVCRPYGWKGNVTTLRDFVRGAALNEIGMEPDEVVAKNPDGGADQDPDGDGVEGELSTGDVTALLIYVAAQEAPVPLERLVAKGLVPPPSTTESKLASAGRVIFEQIGCAACHTPELLLGNPVFREPTMAAGGVYLDGELAVADPDYDPARPFEFHIVQQGDRPRFRIHSSGAVRIELFGDLKRHNMGAALADAQPTPVTGADGRQVDISGQPQTVAEQTFLTAELWGVGVTGPWLHDGRAGTLEEAILLHGVDNPPPPGDSARSEAQGARDAFAALDADGRLRVTEFLETLTLFAFPEEGE